MAHSRTASPLGLLTSLTASPRQIPGFPHGLTRSESMPPFRSGLWF
uniref:Uncharacterized protein n=1 Tax=Fagus sylvatica TaxID=28930 RepID=A0A2N9F5X5_FAGSY